MSHCCAGLLGSRVTRTTYDVPLASSYVNVKLVAPAGTLSGGSLLSRSCSPEPASPAIEPPTVKRFVMQVMVMFAMLPPLTVPAALVMAQLCAGLLGLVLTA